MFLSPWIAAVNSNRVTESKSMKIKGMYQNFMKYKCLLRELVSRDFKLKYRRSVLGYAWSLLNPLLLMLVLTAVFSQVFRYEIESFPVYLILGQTIFNFFADATRGAMESIYASAELIKKVYVPKYMFPLSKVCFCFVNMLCSMLAVLIVMLIERVQVTWTVVFVPLVFFYTFLISLGVGMMLAVGAVYFRDLSHLYGILVTALTYFTPLFYPVEILPDTIRRIDQMNPMLHIVAYFRNVVMYGVCPTLGENLVCLGFGCVFCAAGAFLMKKYQKNFILYI